MSTCCKCKKEALLMPYVCPDCQDALENKIADVRKLLEKIEGAE